MPFSGCVYSMCGIKKGKCFHKLLFHNWIQQNRRATHIALSLPVVSDCQESLIKYILLVVAEDWIVLEYLTITQSRVFPMWLSGFYGLAVYFFLLDSKLLTMAYSLTFNLLALLCSFLVRKDFMFIARFCLLFRFVIQGLIKIHFLDTLSFFWKQQRSYYLKLAVLFRTVIMGLEKM